MSAAVLSVIAAGIAGLGFATWKAPRVLVVLVWALVVTILLTSVIFVYLPMSIIEKGSWLTVLFPLMWAGLQFWAYWEPRQGRVIAVLGVLTVISGLILIFSEPMA